MQTKRILSSGLVAAASLSMLAACGPAANAPDTTPTSSPSAAPSEAPAPSAAPTTAPEPSAAPTTAPEPSAAPTTAPEPSAAPSVAPSADPSAAPTTAPSAEPSPSALPTAQDDISVVERTTFNGKVFDDTQAPLDGVKVVAKSLNSSVPFDAETTTAGGTYAFNNAPSGVQIEIIASRAGYTTRRRVEVLKSNKQGDPNANRYDFGSDSANGSQFGVNYNALSDKPEVTMVTPGRNAAGVDPATSFVLTFSEPMDRATVVDNFEVRAFTTETLSVDDDQTLKGSAEIKNTNGTRVWDKAAFNASWNSDDTEVTMTFREERMLPTDKDSDKTPDYQVTFKRQDSQLKDKSGITRDKEFFKLTDGNFEESFKFAINTDEREPSVSSIVAQTAENSGANSDGDAIKVRYSERMIHYTLGPTIAGGMNNVRSQAAGANGPITAEQAGMNYRVTVIRNGNTQLNQANWSSLGGRAIFDTNDPTHKTVLLLPGTTSGTFTAAGTVANAETLTGTVYYTNGQSSTFTGTVNGTGFANVDAALESITDGGTFTVTEATDGDGTVEANDTYTIQLSAGANEAGAGTRIISNVVINGGTAAADLGITAQNPYRVYAGTMPGMRPNLYQPGDNVIVQVDTTVLDPAGNSVDSSGDDASANAS